jgi:AraC-like DNA-binding protein
VAEKLGISRRMLQRRLEDEHTTFSALLTEVRKERAVYLLASGKHDLSGVAELIGFIHQSTFSRWFRIEFGCSPSAFQRLYSGSEFGSSTADGARYEKRDSDLVDDE